MKTSYIQKFINHLIGKAIVQYKMINDGDRILVAVSGGKDSLTLLWFLRERLKWIPIDYEIIAIHVDMGFSIRSGDKMEAFFKSNNFNYKIIKTDIWPKIQNKQNPCFLCSRMRRKIIFEVAKELDCPKIAFAHHKDDVIETLFLNILYSASISTMLPVQEFFGGRFKIIRPLYMVDESLTRNFVQFIKWAPIETGCPAADSSKRKEIKRLLQDLYKSNKKIKGNIFHALHNIKLEYMPKFT